MPCYDKKLEAARPDFVLDAYEEALNTPNTTPTPEVDLVISTIELDMFIHQTQNTNFAEMDESPLDPYLSFIDPHSGEIRGHAGSSSGGYLHATLANFAKGLGLDMTKEEIDQLLVSNRNTDVRVAMLQIPSSSDAATTPAMTMSTLSSSSSQQQDSSFTKAPLDLLSINGDINSKLTEPKQMSIKFAAMYGFRNIQNLVRKIKSKRCDYDFVEVMACPGGCGNGGGQARPDYAHSPHNTAQGSSVGSKAFLKLVEERYTEDKHFAKDKEDIHPKVKEIMTEWEGVVGKEMMKELLTTQYHPVQSNLESLTVKW